LVAERIEAEQDVAQLDRWLENFAKAKRLADVGIE